MDERLGQLHSEGVTWAHIRERLAESAVVRRRALALLTLQDPYALRALRRLKRRLPCRLICLTSGNALFTSAMLEHAGHGDVFDDVVGQIAEIDDEGRVRVTSRSPIEQPHGCELHCYAGLCKSRALREVVDPDEYDRRIFLGDGINDYCSVRALERCDSLACAADAASGDIALVRANFGLDRLITAGPELVATIKRWHDGRELARILDSLAV